MIGHPIDGGNPARRQDRLNYFRFFNAFVGATAVGPNGRLSWDEKRARFAPSLADHVDY
ncbi:MAG TPA: hypothetical protein VJ302_37260 [Blastocatellia bacterium]|nr:hypothetical protein [Blastocatellia bacterium]